MRIFAPILILLVFSSCHFQHDSSNKSENTMVITTFQNSALGWTMKIPKDWSVTTIQREQEQVGADAESRELQNLLSFQKDQMNSFSSTSIMALEDTSTSWTQAQSELKVILMEVFESQKTLVDSSLTEIVEISGVPFYNYSFNISKPNGTHLYTMEMYSALINGRDFNVKMTYNNEKDKNEMMKVWMNSQFD